MEYLEYDSFQGTYSLKEEYKDDEKIRNRFEKTEEKTCMNTPMRRKQRKDFYDELNPLLIEFNFYTKLLDYGEKQHKEKLRAVWRQIKTLLNKTPSFRKLAACRLKKGWLEL